MRRGNNRSVISSEVKEELLLKLKTREYPVPMLAKAYNVSRATLYKWRKNYDFDLAMQDLLPVSDVETNNFVEVKLSAPALRRVQSLAKASLTFSEFSLVIEGEFCNSRLISLLQNLEASC